MVEQSEPDIGANTSDICCIPVSGVCDAAGDTLTVPLLCKPQSLEDEVVSCSAAAAPCQITLMFTDDAGTSVVQADLD